MFCLFIFCSLYYFLRFTQDTCFWTAPPTHYHSHPTTPPPPSPIECTPLICSCYQFWDLRRTLAFGLVSLGKGISEITIPIDFRKSFVHCSWAVVVFFFNQFLTALFTWGTHNAHLRFTCSR